MLLALMADMHANRQAFGACLEHAQSQGVERYVLLGDFVGYGADPAWVVARAMELVHNGAVAVLGNHDDGVASIDPRFNPAAQLSLKWTRDQLDMPQREFLSNLPLIVHDQDRLYVHADASAPKRWNYVQNIVDAERSLKATQAHITFCGHIHRPSIFSIMPSSEITAQLPVTGVPVTLNGPERWLVVLGSVGQPRDNNPAASYVLFDTDTDEVTYQRVPYDYDGAVAAIRAAKLPAINANRLYVGR